MMCPDTLFSIPQSEDFTVSQYLILHIFILGSLDKILITMNKKNKKETSDYVDYSSYRHCFSYFKKIVHISEV